MKVAAYSVWLSGWLLLALTMPTSALAQIRSDRTLSPASEVRRDGNTFVITGGTESGDNLFHSFREFSVPTGGSASFQGIDSDVVNIFARVTGANVSNIDGAIEALQQDGRLSRADFFLINPNGIIFGANASLNLGGAFIATTADSILFADGASGQFRFSATDPQSVPLLRVSVPIGLQFGSAPGRIVNRSVAPLLDSTTGELVLDETGNPILGLQTRPGQTLALVGGTINLLGGGITAESGRIELTSVASPDVVTLVPIAQSWALDDAAVENFGSIRLDNATIYGNASSDRNGGEIVIRASQLRLDNESDISTTAFASGRGGDIRLEVSQLRMDNAAQIYADTEAEGRSGDLSVRADEIVLTGHQTSLVVHPTETATGDGGDLVISTDRLRLSAGAQIYTTTTGAGNSGRLVVQASDIELTGVALDEAGRVIRLQNFEVDEFGQVIQLPDLPLPESPSGLLAGSFGSGDGGEIVVTADRLVLRDGAVVQTSALAAGNAGRLRVEASEIELSGRSPENLSPTALLSLSGGIPGTDYEGFPDATGQSGDLSVIADSLLLREGAVVATGSFNATQEVAGGDLTIAAQTLSLEDQASLLANTNSGQGGNINLQIEDLLVLQRGSEISTSAGIAGTPGNGGNITIDATEGFIVTFPDENSDITANSNEGRGGRVTLTTSGNFGISPLSLEELQALDPDDPNPRDLATNDITAISLQSPSLSGEITINSPDVDPTRGLAELPSAPITTELAQGCQVEGAVASTAFFNSGRGGVPVTPYEPLSSSEILEDVRLPDQDNAAVNPGSSSTQVVEAQGWMVNQAGQVVLMAEVPDPQMITQCSLR